MSPLKLLFEKVLNKYRPGWKERAARRKSLWHLPKVIMSFIVMGFVWYALFIGMWRVHLIVYPEHAGHISEFWNKGASLKAFLSSFLLAIPLLLPAIGLSFIIVNIVFWFIPPARKVFENESAGDIEMTFVGSTSGIARVFAKYLLPIGFGLSLLGALTLSNLK